MKPLRYQPDSLARPSWQLNDYWNDADTRRRVDAEIEHNRDICNAALDASFANSPHGKAQARRWAEESVNG